MVSLDHSCDFYCSCGYEVADRFPVVGPDAAIGNGLDEARLEVAFVTSPQLTLELVEFDPASGIHLTDGDPAFGCIPVWSKPKALWDPDGRPVAVTAASDRPLIELSTADERKTSELLGLLGFTRHELMLVGHGVDVVLREVEAPAQASQANDTGRIHLCCQVADMDLACAELAIAGFAMVSTPRVHENLQWAFVAHPEGPGIELLSIGDIETSPDV
ncbi:MAG: Glyoxalase/bleomycin resistance protein/dioxygenase [Ilumatobacteraceae bacterium]|nr:Glyoxalase/bleomycin resistance protein/dioxygenase [Ilumatobacteraceae bacterium]